MRVRNFTVIRLSWKKTLPFDMMCVIYCSACATLRDLKVSDVQQTVTDAIYITELGFFSLGKQCELVNCSVIPRSDIELSDALLDSSQIHRNSYTGSIQWLECSFHCITYLAIDTETASVGYTSGLNFIREYVWIDGFSRWHYGKNTASS